MKIEDIRRAIADLLSQGRSEAALSKARAAMNRFGAHPDFPNLAGLALVQLGKHKAAATQFRRAVTLAPGYCGARYNLAQALIQQGQYDAALEQIDKALRQEPGTIDGLILRAQALAGQGDPGLALDVADAAVEAGPRDLRGHTLRARLLYRLGREAEALTAWEAALALAPDHVDTLVAIAMPLARAGRHAEALDAVERAVQLAPRNAAARLQQAELLVATGRFDEAIAACEAVLGFDPVNSAAIEMLARLYGPEKGLALEGPARTALRAETRDHEARAGLFFGLARIARFKQDDAAFARHLSEANAIMARLQPYGAEQDAALAERLITRRYGAPETTAAALQAQGPSPVYVVGLPRSGTTLTEQVLGAHPQVAALGERGVPGGLLAPVINGDLPFDGEAQARFVADDTARLPDLPAGTRAYVDKMPENFRLLGFLLTAYPDARAVNLCRDPRDTALSLWQERFSGTALAYAYDLGAMAHRFNAYARLMAHWRALFPGRILDLPYAELVADPAGASRRLAGFCGLDWVPAMADPGAGAGPVLTVSATQLRQGVHTRSVGRWRQHTEMLAPFIRALDPALWPEIGGMATSA